MLHWPPALNQTESQPVSVKGSIRIYEINGPFFFGAADKFLNAVGSIDHETKVLILRMRNVTAMDATALNAFKRMIKVCHHRGIALFISGINKQPYAVLEKAELISVIGEHRFYETISEAVASASDVI